MTSALAITALRSALVAIRFWRLTRTTAFVSAVLVTLTTFCADAIFFTAILTWAGVLALMRADLESVNLVSAFLFATVARLTAN